MPGWTDTLEIPAFADMHVHVRQPGEQMTCIVPWTACCCSHALCMPNTNPPLLTAEDTENYRAAWGDAIEDAISSGRIPNGDYSCKPIVSIKWVAATKADNIKEAASRGVSVVKLYPAGLTTHSDDGLPAEMLIYSEKHIDAILQTMDQNNMVLCIHGELPHHDPLRREQAFIRSHFINRVLSRTRRLRIVMEHVTTAEAVEYVTELWNEHNRRCAATITAHHLAMTLHDVIGDALQPHNYCKPIAKQRPDMYALRRAAVTHPAFFLGSDSAPHTLTSKETACCAAGCFTSPCLPGFLAQTFEQESPGDVRPLIDFTSTRGLAFYGLPPSDKRITLSRTPWVIPYEVWKGYSEVVYVMWRARCWRGGHTTTWRLHHPLHDLHDPEASTSVGGIRRKDLEDAIKLVSR